MAMSPYPVVIPYQPQHGGPLDLPTLSISAAATTPRNAIAVANAFVALSCQRRYQEPVAKTFLERAQVGKAGEAIQGPYAYVLGRTNHVPIIPFPKRLDHASTEDLRLRINGLVAGGGDTMIVDAAQLMFLDSSALTALSTLGGLASSNASMRIHLFRPSSPIRKVFEIVGLHKLLGIHDTLVQAIAASAGTPQVPSQR